MIQILVFFALVVALTKPVGVYLLRALEGAPLLPRTERLIYRLTGVDETKEQTWVQYAVSLLTFSAITMLVTFVIERLQGVLPLNPRHFGAVETTLAFNTAASFTTNTDWQAYSGESAMSYLTQMAGLAWHNFISAAAGMGVALALARGLTRRPGPAGAPPQDGGAVGPLSGAHTIGNFWVDLVRTTFYVLLPLSMLIALLLVSQGVIQNFSDYLSITTLEGAKQTIALGPVASQEAIKQLGTNGGGFFNANAAHPFENPTPFTNLVSMLLIFAIPAGLTYMYGKMARDTRQGWALFAAMSCLFLVGAFACYHFELGNLEGKETRFGVAASALYATVTTDASCGAVNAMHDSFTPLGGLIPLANIALGELVFGGVGSGLYAILIYVVLTVFIAGLMVGRTPEYLGKKIEAREMKWAMIYVLIFPMIVLGLSAWAAVTQVTTLGNAGPHGLTEILYAFTSGAGNNGSAFAGLNANTTFWNLTLALAMLLGRFGMMVPILGIAGSMIGKKTVVAGPGTFPTNGGLFTALLVAVILVVGALTFFPALSLGPIVEQFVAHKGRVY